MPCAVDFLGAAIGAIAGWVVVQLALNNDLLGIMMYANRAVDQYCDYLCRCLPSGIVLSNSRASLPLDVNFMSGNARIECQDCRLKPKTAKKKAAYPKFSDVIGLEETKETIQESVMDSLRHSDIYKKIWMPSWTRYFAL